MITHGVPRYDVDSVDDISCNESKLTILQRFTYNHNRNFLEKLLAMSVFLLFIIFRLSVKDTVPSVNGQMRLVIFLFSNKRE